MMASLEVITYKTTGITFLNGWGEMGAEVSPANVTIGKRGLVRSFYKNGTALFSSSVV